MAEVPRVSARLAAIGLLFGIATGLVAQLAPPFHVLNHELVQLASLFGCLVQLEVSAMAVRAFPYRPDRLEAAFVSSLACAAAMGLGLQGTTAAANALAHGCETAGTGTFLWLTWAPLAIAMTVAGLALAAWRAVPRVAAFYGLVVACLAHDQLRTDLGLTMADPLLGFVLALDQRASMEMSAVHVLQRGWLFGVAVTGLLALLWSHHRDGARAALAGVAGLAMAAVTVGWGGQLGIGLGEGARRHLDGRHETAHVRLRYDRSGEARHRVEMVGREAEWHLHRLADAWQISLDGVVVRLDLYDDPHALERATGRPFAHARRRRAALAWRDGLDDTLAHELVHAIADLAGSPPWQVDPSRGRTEGSAVAWTEGYAALPEAHAPLAVALRREQLPHAARLMSLSGFWTVPEGRAYHASGSFVGFLVLRYGVAAWRAWLQTHDEERAFGRSLASLDEEWRAFLRDVPVDAAASARADRLFDPRGPAAVTARVCPKLGRRVPGLADEARSASRAGDHARALALYQEQLDVQPSPWLFWARLETLQTLDRHREALEALAAAPEAERYSVRWWDAAIRSWSMLGQIHELRQAIAHRLGRAPDAALRAYLTLLDDPAVQRPALRLLQARAQPGPSPGAALIAQLAEDHPDYAGQWATLAVARELPQAGPVTALTDRQLTRVEHLRAWLAQADAPCEASERGVTVARSLVRLDALDVAEGLVRELHERCPDPMSRWRVGRLRDRIAWERTPTPGP